MAAKRNLTRCAGAALLLAGLGAGGPSPRAGEPDQKFSSGAPGAPSFGPNPSLTCPRSGVATALGYALKGAFGQAKRPEPKQDGRLCAVAQALMAWDPAAGDSPPAPVLAFASANAGLPAPVRRVYVATLTLNIVGSEGHTAQEDENQAVADALRQEVADTLLNFQQARWGLASQRVKKGVVKVAVVMDDPALELDPLPRKLSPGQVVPLTGKVLPPYTNPKLALSDERGVASKPAPIPGDAFKAELRCSSGPGDLWVEVSAERDGQPALVTTFSVACGKDLPASVEMAAAPWPKDLAAQGRRLADGINAQRTAVGLGRVEWDDKLSGAASAVAEVIRDQIGRGEAPAVDLGQMLQKAGVASGLVLQNPAQARTTEEAEQRFTASPTNRQNILNPEVNRIGVGIAPTEGAAGKAAGVIVVELFTKALVEVDLSAVKRDLYAAVAKHRADAAAPPAEADPKLEKVAQDYAQTTAQGGGKISDDDADDITHGIRIAYKSINMVDGAKADPLSFAEDPAVLSPGSSLGIGVAQGDHPVLGKNAVYVAIILGTPRPLDKPKPAAPAAKPPRPKQ